MNFLGFTLLVKINFLTIYLGLPCAPVIPNELKK